MVARYVMTPVPGMQIGCPSLEVLVAKPFRELADRLVFLLEGAKGS